MTCDVQARGDVELYFYGELTGDDRAAIQAHLAACAECRHALDDLQTIRAVLGARPDVATPPAGDWSGFMARLDQAIARTGDPPAGARSEPERAPIRRAVPYLAMAALVTLVTVSVLAIVRGRAGSAAPDAPPAVATAVAVHEPRLAAGAVDPALVSLSDEHFQRSKLVLLGLTTRDTTSRVRDDWQYERELATTLLGDTRLYRQAAEDRGMTALAGVMRDLELVLLQTSMAESADAEAIGQLQRLIRRRDLLTKMDVAYQGGS